MFFRIIDGGLIEQNGLIDLGDIIVEIGGAPINSPDDLMYHVSSVFICLTRYCSITCSGKIIGSNLGTTLRHN